METLNVSTYQFEVLISYNEVGSLEKYTYFSMIYCMVIQVLLFLDMKDLKFRVCPIKVEIEQYSLSIMSRKGS